MDATSRIEQALNAALSRAGGKPCPEGLKAAMHHSVFPRGARVRPRLCLAVASACGEDNGAITDIAAASIELLHCASLVHDDLPCFDNAATRRGLPSVHRAYGEPLALLAGDALIVLAFQNLARISFDARRMSALLFLISRAVGSPYGIVAGQAWECEPQVDLQHYHRAKTGALFSAATCAGAVAAGSDPEPWRLLGETLGEAYQVADDLRDALATEEELGKPAGRDAALGRPNAIHALGVDGTLRRLESLVKAAIAAIPPCDHAAELQSIIASEAKRLRPSSLAQSAA